MKRFLLFALAVIMFAACSKDAINEQQNMQTIVDEAPETLVVGFEESDETRIQLNEGVKTVWTNGDQVSVFYRSDANQKWQYTGETGVRIAELTRVDEGAATEEMKRVVVVYPYNENYYINTETYNIQAFLPAVQTYLKDSYGLNGNIMISQSEYNNFSLKSVCSWLKLQLTGNGEKVKSITLRGNNGEQVAGELYINSADATATLSSDTGSADDGETGGAGGGLVFEDTILTEVTLDCGEGVTLGKEATAFYIALPPQTFEKGFTVEIEDTEGYIMEQSTDKALIIERNHIQPMADFEFVNPTTPSAPTPASNEIWYTSSDGDVVKPYYNNVFGANIISNKYNNGKGIITFDDNVTTIGNWAFSSCTGLTSVNIPDSVTTIGDAAFQQCFSLTSANIPDSVTSIGSSAFQQCLSLTSVNIPDSVTEIENGAFESCESLIEFKGKFAEDNGRILVIDGILIAFAPAGITEYTIPDSVTEIENYTFISCDSLISVNIPDSVTSIGEYAFYKCTNLTSVNIPDSVTFIGEGTFESCYNLTSVNIPDSVTTIVSYTFSGCKSLTSVNIPDSVTMIEEHAFYGCDSLTSVNIGDSVTSIGDNAFAWCTSLTSVTIGDSVTSIGESAFYYCESLTSVYCKATTPPALRGTSVFDANGSGRKIYVPAGSTSAYRSATHWYEYRSAIVGYYF